MSTVGSSGTNPMSSARRKIDQCEGSGQLVISKPRNMSSSKKTSCLSVYRSVVGTASHNLVAIAYNEQRHHSSFPPSPVIRSPERQESTYAC